MAADKSSKDKSVFFTKDTTFIEQLCFLKFQIGRKIKLAKFKKKSDKLQFSFLLLLIFYG
jgi:hypothetical protein